MTGIKKKSFFLKSKKKGIGQNNLQSLFLLPRKDSNLEPPDPESDAIPLGHEAIITFRKIPNTASFGSVS